MSGDEHAAPRLVIPGQCLQSSEGVLRGHGTYENNGILYSSICGQKVTIGKLVFVRPVGNCKYDPDVGDVVVGRIAEVGTDRWYVDIRTHQRGQLMLSAINLPGGQQRRRNAEDQLDMRKHFTENDVVCLEVQRVQADGTTLLHSRNRRYGILRNGCLITIPSTLVTRLPEHMFCLENGVYVVVGNNGMIWLTIPPRKGPSRGDSLAVGGVDDNDDIEEVNVSKAVRINIAKARNTILQLAKEHCMITPKAINARVACL